MEKQPQNPQEMLLHDRKEVEMLGDSIPAYKTVDGSIFLPINTLCEYLGLDRSAQVRRIKRDESLSEELTELEIETTQGLRQVQLLRLEVVPYWLAGVTVSKVKPELREKLKGYKRWVVQKVYEAFMRELANETQPSQNLKNLIGLRELGQALVQLADEQIAIEQQQQILSERQNAMSDQLVLTTEEVFKLKERVDNAAQVVGNALTRIKRLETRTSVGALTEEQAAEISLVVKQVATELAKREQKEGNPYQRVFTTLYQRYNVSSYKLLSSEQFQSAITWLNEWYQSLLPVNTTEQGTQDSPA